MLLFAGPYIYYSILINKAAHENPREGYRFSQISDFWMSIVGAIFCITLKEYMPRFFQPCFINHVKETEDRETQIKYSWKGSKALWDMIQYILITGSGFVVLKNYSNILPWYMGGD